MKRTIVLTFLTFISILIYSFSRYTPKRNRTFHEQLNTVLKKKNSKILTKFLSDNFSIQENSYITLFNQKEEINHREEILYILPQLLDNQTKEKLTVTSIRGYNNSVFVVQNPISSFIMKLYVLEFQHEFEIVSIEFPSRNRTKNQFIVGS